MHNIVNTLLFFITQTSIRFFYLGQSVHSVVSSPTNSILLRQFTLSTCFLFLFLQSVTLYLFTVFSIKSANLFLNFNVLSLYFGFTVVSTKYLYLAPLAPSVNHFLPPVILTAFLQYITNVF